MPTDIEHIDSTKALKTFHIRRAAELMRMADRNVRQTQGRYKQDHDRKVRLEPTFAPGHYVFVILPPLITTAARRLPARSYSNPRPRRLGPYRAMSVGHKVVRILQDAVEVTVYTNRVNRAAHNSKFIKKSN